MAQGVRSRSLRPARTALVVAVALLPAACGDTTPPVPPTAPRSVDTAAIAESDVVAAVLDECHRPLRGRLDRVAATVRLPDGSEVRLFAELPDRLRAVTPVGGFLLRGDEVFRLDDSPAAAATPAQAAHVRQLRTLLDAATLGPLHRARGCRRLGPAKFELAQPQGAAWCLDLRPGTLLPQVLTGPDGSVRIDDHLRTSTTWMVRRAELDGLGRCDLRLDLADLDWTADFFTLPDARGESGRARKQMQVAPVGGEPRSATPFLVETRATRWVVIPDPGDWARRVAAYRPLHAELERQAQQLAGFTVFWREDDRQWLAQPFRGRDGGPEWKAPDGWSVREVPAGRWLVVYPPAGDLSARIADGERLLHESLADQGLAASGPIVAQPFIHLHEGEPEADKLAAPVVRVSVPLRP